MPPSEPALATGLRGGQVWRLVEAQHKVSTMKLVDSLEEQQTLEELLDGSKPPVPAPCRHLHWLLFTPFRYPARYGTRFRRAGEARGVFYAAERVETAVAEMAFWRRLFFLESPGLRPPANALEMTAFCVGYRTAVLDLTLPPWGSDPALHDPVDYAACQAAADTARRLGAGAIRHRSVRDPGGGANLAILSCAAFTDRAPVASEIWRLRLTEDRVMALGEARGLRLEFPYAGFGDPRLTGAGA